MAKKMKQHITPKQLNELSIKAKLKLSEHFNPKETIKDLEAGIVTTKVPLLSIGQMIEFLGDNKIHNFHPIDRCHEIKGAKGWHVVMGKKYGGLTHDYEELVDALWEAVKEILEGGDKDV